MIVTRQLNCRDLKCPMPIVQLAMAMRDGDTVAIEATDPAFLVDVRAWSRMTGNPIASEVDAAIKHVVIRKASQP